MVDVMILIWLSSQMRRKERIRSQGSKAGHICPQRTPTSVSLKFCEDTFALRGLTDRDGQSNGMNDYFDPTQPCFLRPNSVLNCCQLAVSLVIDYNTAPLNLVGAV